MLKRSIAIGSLFIAGHAYSANITVTSTEDIVKDDKECSLREAIEYINQGMKEEGYYGCGGKDATNIIELKSKTVYRLNSQIRISKSLSIRTVYSSTTENGEEAVKGLLNATLQMVGTDRIFQIEDTKKAEDKEGNEIDYDNILSVNLTEVNLQGCGDSKCKQDKGGLIYNDEVLTLEYVKLSGGQAAKGGAIYNVAVPYKEGGTLSRVFINDSLFEKNTADQGAVLYSMVPQFIMQRALVIDNETTSTASAAIETEKSAADDKTEDFPKMKYYVLNTTFMRNKGNLIRLRDEMGLNNLTVVANTGGILLDAPFGKAYMANSIVVGNPYPVKQSMDCTVVSGDKSILQNNLAGAGCGTGSSKYPNEIWSGTKLIAGDELEGSCNPVYTDKESLLCPLVRNDKMFLGYLRPRIPLIYKTLAESVIIDKGKAQIGTDSLITCMGTDQRSVNRQADYMLCDRGAIEVVVPESLGTLGDEFLPGQTIKLSIAEALGDIDLLPADQCDALVGKKPDGEAWQAGCMQVEQTHTASKGRVSIDNDGNITYVPNSAWKGADTFKIKVITTATRFNLTDKYVPVNVNILVEPDNVMESSKVKTSGGSFGWLGVIGMFALAGLRRFKK
jgi:rhombotarget A family protien